MSALSALAVVGAGLVAGTINTIVGSGSLITFPTLLAFGFGPVVANVSNTVGLVPGSLSGAIAYRAELRGQRPRLVVLGSAAVLGGITGAVLLLTLPGSVFRHVVPALILVACTLVALQPRLAARVGERRRHVHHGGPALAVSVFVTGVYGGYFGAAQGVILVSLLGIFFADHLQRLNAAKNVLALVVNAVAALLFIGFANVSWEAAGLIASGSVVGGQLGGALGRRLPAPLLRTVIIVVGVAAAVALLV
ncbi:MAG TPA: sulfite exporter TauE/SafE family protein [Acidimicrobiales bacterium]|nr:sulfite exporter TauE/SafE family protein [Acidimicrobiales bacterium]